MLTLTQQLLIGLIVIVFLMVVGTIVLGIKNKDKDYFVVSLVLASVIVILAFGVYFNGDGTDALTAYVLRR